MNTLESVFSLNVSDGVIHIVFLRSVRNEQEDLEIAKRFEKTLQDVFQQFPNTRLRIFFNLLAIKQSDYYTKGDARKIYIRIFSHPQIEYVATAVKSSFFSLLIDFYIHAIDQSGRFKVFTDKNTAIQWLTSRSS